ncbi:MAG: uroporphyrinogen-III synthase [Actinomycetota bacterium]|nr:uroporphyrinogen-III synthase [Actinomycetota bacterium]
MVVTRAGGQADGLAELLRERGAVPVVVPLVQIVAEPDGVAALAAVDPGAFDWLVVTSPNAAEAYLQGHRRTPAQVAAVGAATAAVLTGAGHQVQLVPARQRAEGLVHEFPAGLGRVLLVQAQAGEAVLADGLAAKGWTLTVVRPYRAAPAQVTPADAARALAADAVLFASGSAARAWTVAFGPVAPPTVVAIGPQTAAVVTAVGLKVTVIAADHSLPGLVQALEQHLATGK